MGRASKPRAGSLQFWPRKRAKRIYPKIRSWKNLNETKLLGFLGYKVGMTHVQVQETNPSLKTASYTRNYPVTILECPPIKLFSIRFYKNTDYGLKVITEVVASNLNKELSRKVALPKAIKSAYPDVFNDLKDINPKSGFNNYGIIKNDYVLIKGSIPGAKKRLIVITYPLRFKKLLQSEVKYIKK